MRMNMKKALMISATASLGLLLSACGKESAFKSAINESFKENYECIYINQPSFFRGVRDLPEQVYEKYEKDSVDFVVKRKEDGIWAKNDNSYDEKKEEQLNALVKAGVLSKTEKTEQAVDEYSKKPIANVSFVVEAYHLTQEGEKASDKKKSDYGFPLCYAHKEVDKVENYREASPGGMQIAEVKYSFRYIDIAKWAKDKEVQTQFPQIKETLENKDNIGIMGLEKTNNGWESAKGFG